MKKHFILVCLALLLCQLDGFCQGNLNGHVGMVQYLGSNAEGTINIQAAGFAKKKKESIIDAESDAFYTLLFRGIPGSQYKQPMITKEEEFREDPIIVEILKGGYVSFMTNANLTSEVETKKKADGVKGVQTLVQMTINCAALRKYLEDKKIIRKFGL
jgi:hypothetical protein